MTPGIYLFIVGSLYFIAGMIDVFFLKFAPVEALQICFLAGIAAPLIFPWLGRRIGLKR